MKLNEVSSNRTLKTKRGSTIRRSKFGVGKLIGGNLYLHKNYVSSLPKELKNLVLYGERFINNFSYNAVKINLSNPIVSYMNSPDFDTADEPTVGEFITLNGVTKNKKTGKSNAIWHHKWLWVKDDYSGFDVDKSFERSKKYLEMDMDTSRIGNKEFWNKNYANKL